MSESRKITIHNVMKEMRLDCDGESINDLEITYYNSRKNKLESIRSNYIAIKMNNNEDRDIDIEWE